MESFKEYTENTNDNFLIEAGFSRILEIMSGLVPTVKTFAIVTWENPMDIKLKNSENLILNKKLEEHLKRGAYGYSQIKGKYENYENPFFIMNITRKNATQLGVYGKQESIIFGNVHNQYDITFKMIYCFEDKVYERHIWKSLDKKEEDFYSEYKGRKFYIPFFDDEMKDTKFNGGKIEKEDYNIFHEKDFDSVIINEVNSIIESDMLNDEQYVGKHLWLTRGSTYTKLRDNQKKI
jgi:hypothetical protein